MVLSRAPKRLRPGNRQETKRMETVMANYRSVHVKLWADPKIEPLPPDAKYLFLYLITNEHRNESGLYSLTVRTMSNETRLTPRRVNEALKELDEARRVAYDGLEGVVWVVNAARHITMNANCIKSIAKDLEFCSSELLRQSFCKYYTNHPHLQEVSKRFRNGSPTVWDGFIEPINRGRDRDRGQGLGNRDKCNEIKSEIEIPVEVAVQPGFVEAWNEWEEYRREIKKPLTMKARKKQWKFLARQPDAVAVLEQSIRNQWQGLFELKESYATHRAQNAGGGRERKTFTHADIAASLMSPGGTRSGSTVANPVCDSGGGDGQDDKPATDRAAAHGTHAPAE